MGSRIGGAFVMTESNCSDDLEFQRVSNALHAVKRSTGVASRFVALHYLFRHAEPLS